MANRNAVNIHVDGFVFPGKQIGNYWKFPTIKTKKANSEDEIYTTFYVGLLKSTIDKKFIASKMNKLVKNKPNPDYDPNFSLNNICDPIKEDYFYHELIPNLISFYVTEVHHEGSPDMYRDMTFVSVGKNLGKKNRTNVFTQTMRDVLGKYNKKQNISENINNVNIILPMLAFGEEGSGNLDKIYNRCSSLFNDANIYYVQPKYDGIRTLTISAKSDFDKPYVDNDSIFSVIPYSRKGHKIMLDDHLMSQLETCFEILHEKYGHYNFVLDGEYYLHGMALQTISGYARGETSSLDKNKVNLILYDVYTQDRIEFKNRIQILKELKTNYDRIHAGIEAEYGKVFTSETNIAKTTDEMFEYYKAKLEENYEGVIVRKINGFYESNKRSKNLIKLKPILSYEYTCVSYEFGKGKNSEIPVIICKIGTKGIRRATTWWNKRGKTVTVYPKNTITFKASLKGYTEEQAIKLGKSFQEIMPDGSTRFDGFYKGKKATIEFLDYSELNLVPEKSHFVGWAN